MPELPEVETVKNVLNSQIKGLRIKEIELRYEPMVKNMSADVFKEKLTNQVIEEISRRGKYLVFHFQDYQLLSHLRMKVSTFMRQMF